MAAFFLATGNMQQQIQEGKFHQCTTRGALCAMFGYRQMAFFWGLRYLAAILLGFASGACSPNDFFGVPQQTVAKRQLKLSPINRQFV